jgi:hypothetical protein
MREASFLDIDTTDKTTTIFEDVATSGDIARVPSLKSHREGWCEDSR